MSWLFLTGTQVFKLKKPVCFPFLDFTTLQAREFYCREEVRLNARMAPGVYLGLAALQQHGGTFALVPESQKPAPAHTVDWLVCMRRLPWTNTLAQRIADHRLAQQDMDALVDLLAAFYRTAPRVRLAGQEYVARFEHAQPANREVLLRPQFHLGEARRAIDGLDGVLTEGASVLRERAAGQHIVDGHGDLRPDHVFVLQPPVVIDCLEFNPTLRQVDPFDELAYLGLECNMAGAAWIGPQLVKGLSQALQGTPHPALVPLYTMHRALLRARLAMAHLLDPSPRTPEKWQPLAERYIAHALASAQAFTATMRRGSS